MESALVGDIGATNARFAVLRDGAPSSVQILSVAAYPSLGDAIATYFKALARAGAAVPRQAALAVAGPVTGDYLSFTNHPWSFSQAALARDLKLDRLDVVNDFLAVAMAIPRLHADDRRQVGAGVPVPDAPVGIIGPGTGLGVSILAPAKCAGSVMLTAIPGEGGHATLPAVTEREAAIVALLHANGRKHVSAETLICGAGLVTLYDSLCALDGRATPALEPAEVTERAISRNDPVAVEALDIFCAMLGTVTGNLALTAGTRGGIYIAGGIVPRLGDLFDRSEFRARFVAKGRMRGYLEPIPTYVITNPLPAFLGLAELIARK